MLGNFYFGDASPEISNSKGDVNFKISTKMLNNHPKIYDKRTSSMITQSFLT